ncbi:4-hydroxybenzoate polyprenyltransferase, mitochondrial [Ostrinia nubilalis]|uniref:4-hydroxybenzoate polyprenyltransferase, mitochondrial n=1 Tax=Ostrinia nubilalis TaxID=29057 RepID=UPI0030823BB2
MFNTTLKQCKPLQIKTLLQYRNVTFASKHKLVVTAQFHSCLCRHRQDFFKNARTHSTQSDQHRQKVVIETTEPKIVIDNKVLPDEKLIDEKTLQEFWKRKVLPYVQLARWDRPIGVYLLYWPCTWSIALGSLPGNVPLGASLQAAGLFLAGAGLMRGAGCTINDLWDKDVDRQVERTKNRPLVSGAITDKQAIAFLGVQLSLALGILLQLNCYSVLLGAGSMLFVITYPLAKRYTNYPQIFLGATFNWGALLGYSAVQGTIDPAVCGPLYLGALAWTVVYDTIYAHQDKEDDARIGMKSTALTFGAHTKPLLSGTLAASAACLAGVGHAAALGWPYYAALAAAGARAGHQIYSLDVNNPDDCAKKFKSNSLFGLIILLGILGGGYSQYIENRQKNRGKEDLNLTKSCVFS